MTTLSVRSQELHARARELVPGGVHSNSRRRSTVPLYVERASGAYLWDVDGVRYLDCTMGNGSIVLGHGYPRVTDAVRRALESGVTAGYETALAVEVVELLAELVPGFGQVRFANTGTEAMMHALHIARAATGRERVAKAEGAYHGWADPLWVSCWPRPEDIGAPDAPAAAPGSRGLSRHSAETMVLPFNDLGATETLLRSAAPDLAAVVVEPVLIDVGFVPADREYLEGLRRLTEELGIVLVFDELLTGFRIAPGGARELYGIAPDLTTYGKAIANGYPLAAVEGRPELMQLTEPGGSGGVGYVGTFNGHAIALAAARASLVELRDGVVQRRLELLTNRLRSRFEELARRHGVAAQLAGGGGHFQPYFVGRPVRNYRDALAASARHYETLRSTLASRQILVADGPLLHCALSAAHTEDDVDRLVSAAEGAFVEIARSC